MTPPTSLPAIGQRLAARLSGLFARTFPLSPRSALARGEGQGEGRQHSEAPLNFVQQKSSITGPLIAFDYLHRPVWTPRDYEAFAREGFMQNAIVYRCVRMIAEAAATVPLCLYSGADEIDDHPLLSLMRRPNPYEAGPDLLQAFYG